VARSSRRGHSRPTQGRALLHRWVSVRPSHDRGSREASPVGSGRLVVRGAASTTSRISTSLPVGHSSRLRASPLGQVDARQRHPPAFADAEDLRSRTPGRHASSGTSCSTRSSTSTSRDRPDAALESGDLHRVFDNIRRLFADTQESRVRGYQPGRFSFNVSGGRCDACSGDGTIKIEMNFSRHLRPCEVCKGAAITGHLEVLWRGKSIADILELSCEEALEFFAAQPRSPPHEDPRRRRARLRASRPAGADALGWRGPAVKLASELSSARPDTRSTSRRADHGLHFETYASCSVCCRPRRPGQHGDRHRAQSRCHQDCGLDHRPRPEAAVVRHARRRGTPEQVGR